MDLLTPEAHAGAYEWAAVLLAHFAVGFGLAAVLALIIGRRLGLATLIVALVAGYGAGWEGMVQGYGAGLMDAAVDTVAVTCGGVAAWAAWHRRARLIGLALSIMAAVAAIGIRKRDR